jgi:carotenoid cleavage dioxygenase-like enzyme
MNELTEQLTANEKVTQEKPPRFPRAILSLSREEFYGQDEQHQPLELTIRSGKTNQPDQLPTDLKGHLFLIAPSGAIDSPRSEEDSLIVFPSQDGWTLVLGGDGMIYRFDFQETLDLSPEAQSQDKNALKKEAGKAWLATRLVKNPSYYADEALNNNRDRYNELGKYPFKTLGIARLSVALGSRDPSNTALLAFKLPNESERLLVTSDVGRPWEIDPYSLATIAPVGYKKDWTPVVPQSELWRYSAFPPVMNSAHPVFDSNTKEIFTVNVSKSLSTLLNVSHWLIYRLDKYNFPGKKLLTRIVQIPFKIVDFITIDLLRINDILYLVRWDGKNELKKWQVVLKNKRTPKINQTLHQIGLSEKYILLADTSLKIELDDFIPDLKLQDQDRLENHLREVFSYPQAPQTVIYIVPREKLNPNQELVEAYEVTLPEALVHYLVDYENPEGKILFHTAHMSCWDTAEFVHKDDNLILEQGNLKKLNGMVSTPADFTRLASYIIEPETGKFSTAQTTDYIDSPTLRTIKTLMRQKLDTPPLQDYNNSPWAIAFFAHREDREHQPTKKFEDIYWNSWGLWGDLFSDFLTNMYKNYNPRILAIEEVQKLACTTGIPAELFRVRIERFRDNNQPPEVSIVDRYTFPPSYFGTSAQFVPKEGSTEETDGYIICMVIHSNYLLSDQPSEENWSNNSEVWIFDASNLADGVQYKLSHPKLNFGFTAHTTWLREIKSPPPRKYDIKEDYKSWWEEVSKEGGLQKLFAKLSGDPKEYFRELKELFEQDIYPHFPSRENLEG